MSPLLLLALAVGCVLIAGLVGLPHRSSCPASALEAGTASPHGKPRPVAEESEHRA